MDDDGRRLLELLLENESAIAYDMMHVVLERLDRMPEAHARLLADELRRAIDDWERKVLLVRKKGSE